MVLCVGIAICVFTCFRGRSQKSGEGGAKILDRKPHPLINAETGSNYYSVRVPANNTFLSNNNEQRKVDELRVTVKSLEPAIYSLGGSEPTKSYDFSGCCVHCL